MSSTTARIGAAVVGNAIIGTSDMPDETQDHFTWEGHCWELVTDPALNVALMDPSAPASAKEALVARQVQSMSVATKKLIVTDEAILNHATRIGQTVVDDINVQGKLIGRDGVFTGTVDFENVNVTGTQLVNKLGANSIDAAKISGGSFSARRSWVACSRAASSRLPPTLDGTAASPSTRRMASGRGTRRGASLFSSGPTRAEPASWSAPTSTTPTPGRG